MGQILPIKSGGININNLLIYSRPSTGSINETITFDNPICIVSFVGTMSGRLGHGRTIIFTYSDGSTEDFSKTGQATNKKNVVSIRVILASSDGDVFLTYTYIE